MNPGTSVKIVTGLFAFILSVAPSWAQQQTGQTTDLHFTTKLETVLKHDDGKFLWFHPSAAALPIGTGKTAATIIMTLQKHLEVSDFYSGVNVMRTDDLGKTWTKPDPRPELDWVREPNGVIRALINVMPRWHAMTRRLLAIGAHVRYKNGRLLDKQRATQIGYSVYDPKTGKWSKWRAVDMPADEKFDYTAGMDQWLVEPDGTLLLPVFFGPSLNKPQSVTVVRCSFDGKDIKYLKHGDEISQNHTRGLAEPSVVKFQGAYYMTIRHDLRGYVTVSKDGLRFRPIRTWTFDDGRELGSYNTRQMWLVHSDGLFLVYTRRGADNDHVFRHRAPLFIARVDPQKLQVVRQTERVLIPERGATLGNFAAAAIDQYESWVTVAEGIWNDASRQRGAEGALFVARVKWSRPNRLAGR